MSFVSVVAATVTMTSCPLKNGKTMHIGHLKEHPEVHEQVASLLHDEWRAFWTEMGYPDAPSLLVWLRAVKSADSLPYYAVAFIDNELAAIGGTDVNEREGDTRGPWLIDVFVLPAYRGCGAFKHLVTHLMRVQQGLGVEKMYLWTKPHQKVLYEQLGWEYLQDEEWLTEDQGMALMPVMTVDLTRYPAKAAS